jgi:hypothetical protein
MGRNKWNDQTCSNVDVITGRRLIASSNPTPARYRRRPCGVAWMQFRTLMVEYINKWDFLLVKF